MGSKLRFVLLLDQLDVFNLAFLKVRNELIGWQTLKYEQRSKVNLLRAAVTVPRPIDFIASESVRFAIV